MRKIAAGVVPLLALMCAWGCAAVAQSPQCKSLAASIVQTGLKIAASKQFEIEFVHPAMPGGTFSLGCERLVFFSAWQSPSPPDAYYETVGRVLRTFGG